MHRHTVKTDSSVRTSTLRVEKFSRLGESGYVQPLAPEVATDHNASMTNNLLKRSTLAAAALLSLSLPAIAEEALSVERRIGRTARYLASDNLAGRGIGTPGIELAADYIRREFAALGLKTDSISGGAKQTLSVTLTSTLGENNRAALIGPNSKPIELTLGEDYTPLAIGGSSPFDAPLVFVGYGITAPDLDYDDYAGIDVTGKAVIILRHEPQQANPHSGFNGTDNSTHAPFAKKVSNAFQHGAAAVIFTTDQHEILQRVAQAEKRLAASDKALAQATDADNQQRAKLQARIKRDRERVDKERDPLLSFERAGTSSTRDTPVLYVRRGPLDQMLAAADKPSLAELERQIDQGSQPELQPQPRSFDLPGWRLTGQTDLQRETVESANVIGVLAGSDLELKQAIVIGAHYDHLGRGGEGSAQPGSREIHNGADDNASGVAALLEIARNLTANPPRRTIVFVAFTGEERGLLGSAEYVKNPVVPLAETIAMLNFDMVGRLKDNKLIVNGTGTAEQFDQWIDQLNDRHGFEISKTTGGFGPSDHTSFYAKQIPVLHFFTGTHPEYHRPGDDFGLLNLNGIRRVSAFAAEFARKVANHSERVSYVEVDQPRMQLGKSDPRPYFGSIPDFGSTNGAGTVGYAISGVAPGSPSAEGGLQAGDKITALGKHNIANLEDFDNALRKFAAGDKVKVVVNRGGTEVELEVILDPPK